jgi:nicotinamidase/pyrazinamidase
VKPIFVDVDTQRDFCDPGGALSVRGAPNDVFRLLVRAAAERGAPILGSVDSHAYDAWEFASSASVGPNGEDPRFPDHCVKGTPGWLKIDGTLPARFRFVASAGAADPEALARELADGRTQALYFEKEVYSLFANPLAEPVVTSLRRLLAAPRFFVFGVATDYCVKAAALGLRERGCDVTVLTDAIAAVTGAGGEAALGELARAGVALAASATLL